MVKRIVKNILRKLGYTIRKIPQNSILKNHGIIETEIGGFRLKINSGNPLKDWYKRYPEYNSEIARLAEIILLKYPHYGFIDVGANIGDTVCLIKYKTKVKFICIEGDPIVFPLLKENLSQFRDGTIISAFLGEATEAIEMVTEKKGWNSTLLPASENQGEKIQLHTLDALIQPLEDRKDYKLLKIDTEGFDTKILRGASGFLNETRPVIFFEYNRDNMNRIGENGLDTLSFLRQIGYDFILVYESMGRFILSATLEDSQLIRQLHEYADGKNAAIYYFDLCVFHKEDRDIALKFIKVEENYRLYGNDHQLSV